MTSNARSSFIGSSVTVSMDRPGEGLSTGRNVKLGESALDTDSGVPTELNDPGNGLEVVSNLPPQDSQMSFNAIRSWGNVEMFQRQ